MGDGTTGGGSPPPGWYPDPEVAGQQRWWDGAAWTNHAAPMGGATGAVGGAAPAPQQQWGAGGVPGAAPVGATSGVAIDTWLWQSIVATVACCMPLGIPAIVFASQAQAAINMGNLAEAQRKADQAKTFVMISAGLAIVPVVLLFFWVVGMGAVFRGW